MGYRRLSSELREYILLKKEGIRCAKLARYEDSLWYFFYAAETAWRKFFGFYVDEEIEEWIRLIGRKHSCSPQTARLKNTNQAKLRIAHITSLITDTGGHSQFIYNLIRNHNRDKFEIFFYSTEMEDSFSVGNQMIAKLQGLGAAIWFAQGIDSLIEKGQRLYQRLSQDNIAMATIHMNPSDVAILYALSAEPRPLTIFFHQADFVFSLGSNYFDYHLDYRKNGFEHCQQIKPSKNRGCIGAPAISQAEAEKVSCPKREELGFTQEAILTATVTNVYKILFAGEKNYFQMLESLLEGNPHIYHIIIGTGSNELVEKLKAILAQKRDSLKRVSYFGQRNDALNIIKAIDIYLDSFPISGGLSSLGAMALKKPIVSMVNKENSLYSLNDLIGLKECLAYSQEEYVRMALGLAANENLRSEIGQKLYERYLKKFSGEAATKQFEEFCLKSYEQKDKESKKDFGRATLLAPNFADKSLLASYIKVPGWHLRRSHFLDMAHRRYEQGARSGMKRDLLLALRVNWLSSLKRGLGVLFLLAVLNKRLIKRWKIFKHFLELGQRT